MTTIKAAVRSLLRAPGFSTLVVITLALGIGATTAMFSVVDAIVLRPLPYPDGERFAEVQVSRPGRGSFAGVPAAAFGALRETLAPVGTMEAVRFATVTLTGGGEPVLVAAPYVTPGLLGRAGAAPIAGRVFNDEDLAPGTRVVVISERLWQDQFGGDASIVGRVVTLDDQPATIIGVLPRRYRFPTSGSVMWQPLDAARAPGPGPPMQAIVIRRPGVSPEQLADRLRVASDAASSTGVLPAGARFALQAVLQQRYGRQEGGPVWLLFGAVGMVLLVGCVNVANLLLARSASRHRETAVRNALGAGPFALIRDIVAESAILALAGGAGGTMVATILLRSLVGLIPRQIAFTSNVEATLDARALGFAVVVSLATCVLVGVLPAWRGSHVGALEAIRRQSSGVLGGDDRWQGMLVSAQLAAVLVLLAAAGVLLESVRKLVVVDPGFQATGLVAVDVQLPARRYQEAGTVMAVMRELAERVELAGPFHATIASGPPLAGSNLSFAITAEAEGGRAVDTSQIEMPSVDVEPDYFSVAGIPIVKGRPFARDERDVIIVNDVLARQFWGEASPIGRRFRLRTGDPWKTVVGVAGDVRQLGLDDPTRHGMEFYEPIDAGTRRPQWTLLVRSPGDAAAAIRVAKQVLHQIDPGAPVTRAARMVDLVDDSVARQRFASNLLSVFTALAILLASVGVYAVAAYWVICRRREIAIRVALGSSRAGVMRLVLGRVGRLATAGILIGLALSGTTRQVLSPLLFQTNPGDPVVLGAVSFLLAALALAATALPAARSCAVDPNIELRAE